jgi:hypothetical protein
LGAELKTIEVKTIEVKGLTAGAWSSARETKKKG